MRPVFFWIILLTSLASSSLSWAGKLKVWHEVHKGAPSWVKAEGAFTASPEKVWNSLIRFNDYKTFMPRVQESFAISEEGLEALRQAPTRNANKLRVLAQKYKIEMQRQPGKKWDGFVFMVLDMPFPVENRWYVIHASQDETKSAQHIYQRCWDLVFGNIEAAQGCWTLKPSEDGKETVALYEDSVNPGGKVPQWATRMGATKTVPEIFESLEKVASSGI